MLLPASVAYLMLVYLSMLFGAGEIRIIAISPASPTATEFDIRACDSPGPCNERY